MASFYGRMADTATGLLTKFGALVVLRSYTNSYDPVTGKNTRVAVDKTTTGAFIEIDYQYMQTHDVQTGDRMLMIDASVAPEMDNAVVWQGDEWVLANIEPINPAGTPVAYTLQLRQ